MKNWTPSESYLQVPQETVLDELKYVTDSLSPCGDRAAGVMIAKALDQFGTPDNWHIIVDDYLEELAEIPADLLEEIWRNTRRNCKYMPKIADLLEPVSDKIAARKIKKMKLEVMLSLARKKQ